MTDSPLTDFSTTVTLADARAHRPHAKRRARSAPNEPDHVIKLSFLITEDGAHGDKRPCGDGALWQGNAPPSEGRSPSFRYYRQQDRAKPRRGGGSADSPFVSLYFAKLGI